MQILIETCLSLSIENTDSDYSQRDEIHFHKMHFKLVNWRSFKAGLVNNVLQWSFVKSVSSVYLYLQTNTVCSLQCYFSIFSLRYYYSFYVYFEYFLKYIFLFSS